MIGVGNDITLREEQFQFYNFERATRSWIQPVSLSLHLLSTTHPKIMGFCFSCCRRRRDRPGKDGDGESQRLLRPDTDANALKHPEQRTPYEKVADVLASLHAGKLPSQQQIDSALRKLLRSELFDVDSVSGHGGDGDALDESAKKIISDGRDVAGILLQVGLEKNDDDRVQDLVYQLRELSTRTIPVDIERSAEVRVNEDAADKVQTAASAIPSQNELAEDMTALISSFRTLAKLLLTSSAFRLIVGDLLLTVRQFVADAAAQVKQAAEAVENVSEAVERNVRPESGAIDENEPALHEVRPVQTSGPEESRSPKEAMLDRIEDIFRRAQASPQYNSALRTLLYVFRKYAERVSIASTALSETAQSSSEEPSIQLIAPVIVPDPRFSRALEDLRLILERFASGKSLEPSLQALFKTIHDISAVTADSDGSDAQAFFREVGSWLDTALANPTFVNSRAGRDTASRLYDEASSLMSKDTQLSENIRVLLDEVTAFVEAIKSDRTTGKLIQALDNLHSDFLSLLGRTAENSKHAATHWRTTLPRIVLGWLLPRVLRAIRVLPMPRVEYVSKSSDGTQIAAAVDALLLSAEEALVPDVLSVQQFAEVRVEIDENVGAVDMTNPNARLLSTRKRTDPRENDLESALPVSLPGNSDESVDSAPGPKGKKTNVITTSRVRIHIEGLRVAAHDVGYYASYAKNSWLGYTDEGLLSVEIGHSGRHQKRRGEGLAVDVELELSSDSESSIFGIGQNARDTQERLFRVLDVRTAIPGLTMHIAHSRHWILNSLLAPLAGPIGRTVVPWILNGQVKNILESLEQVLREVRANASEKAENRAKENQDSDAETAASDWWDAVLEKFSSQDSEEDESEGETEEEVYTETRTEATLTGVVRTTLEQPEREPQNEAPPPTENALSVGLGAQLLPGKGEPTTLGIERESPQEAAHKVAETAREAVDDVQGKVQHAKEGIEDAGRKGMQEAVRVRRLAEETGERMENQERRERKRRGWRSRAFDL
ncbi:hypothetical protein ACEPAG_7767 [Sanghuangporus baumii]